MKIHVRKILSNSVKLLITEVELLMKGSFKPNIAQFVSNGL